MKHMHITIPEALPHRILLLIYFNISTSL